MLSNVTGKNWTFISCNFYSLAHAYYPVCMWWIDGHVCELVGKWACRST